MHRFRFVPFVLLLAASSRLGAQSPSLAASEKGVAMRAVNVRRAVTPTVSVRLVGGFASLRIVGWAKDSVAIEGKVPVDARFESAWGGDAARPSPGGKAFLEVPEHAGVARPAGALEMRVPERARVWIKGGSATIEAVGVRGGLDLSVVGGAIRVVGSPQELRADAMDGTITIDGAPAWMRAKTAAGDIVVRGGSEDAGLSSVSGAIRVGEGRWDRLRLESVAGGVSFAGDVAHGASLEVDTHGGPVTLRLSPKLGAELDLTSVAGTIVNAWNDRTPIAGREGRGMELATIVNGGGGGARIVVRTFKGPVRLEPR